MGERATELSTVFEGQIDGLVEALSGADPAKLGAPCPGREKLGDGTVGALASHTVDNYARIAGFVAGDESPQEAGGHRRPRHRLLGHRRRAARHGHAAGPVDQADLIDRLAAARRSLAPIAALTDDQLDAIPPEGSFKLCDGRRSLEAVLAALSKHQAHQVEALQSALA